MQHSDGSFFGRRKGKTIRATQREALDTLLPALLVDIAEPAPPRLHVLFPVPVDEVRLEIGFGGGEHLIHTAQSLPRVGFIGVEPFANGMAKAVAAVGREDIGNIRLFDRDAVLLLDWLPAGSLAQIDLLFPDPWPKTRHRRRRFVNSDNLDRVVRALAPGGSFRFASDVDAYVKWTIREVARHGGLAWTTAALEECRTPWDGWPGTRYEAKAIAEGRRPAYLTFRKPSAP
jgi:tRNA (guanine-N7-)-methyltransferase